MFTKQRSLLTTVAILCATSSLTACGGGGSDTTTTPPPAGVTAPSNLSYPSPGAFTVGQAITPLTPTVTGTVSGYSVSPPLPAGLAVDTGSGAISGTPAAIVAQTKYTVTASNSGGSTTADVMMTINDVTRAPAPPSSVITYPSATVVLATNQPIDNRLVPVVLDASVGAITSWSISPALPAGLVFNSGGISGIPTADSGPTAYTITAANAGGQYTFVMTLSVHSGVVLDVGHGAGITAVKFDGTHVFSLDGAGHWILWNYASGAQLANGDAPCLIGCDSTSLDLAGALIAIQSQTGIEIRSITDGHLVSTITGPSRGAWKLAADGSYVVAGNGSGGLQVWSTATGNTLLTKPAGNYDPATVYAAAGDLRAPITVGGGAHVIETTSISTGVATNSPSFTGDFNEWFADGNRFQSTTPTAVYTYSLGGTLLDTTTGSLGLLRGNGDWFGSLTNGALSIYRVGANGAATASYSISTDDFLVNGTMFTAANLLRGGGGPLTFIDVSAATPVRTDRELPIGGGDVNRYTYAALSATQWVIGSVRGVLFDGASSVAAPRYFDYGAVLSIAGSESRFAIATASGRVLHYNSATGALEGTINDFSEALIFSADGSKLAARGAFTEDSGTELTDVHKARIYSLPDEGVLSTWPANNTDPPPLQIDLSANGAVFGQIFSGGLAAAAPATGGTPTWTTAGNCIEIHLSPDGTQIGCNAPGQPFPASTPYTWQLFANSSVSQGMSLDGQVSAWLDSGHILVDHYYFFAHITPMFSHATINSSTGAELSTSDLPSLAPPVQVLAPDSVYSREQNAILTVGSNTATWLSATRTGQIGAVSGSNVIFASGHYVLSLPR